MIPRRVRRAGLYVKAPPRKIRRTRAFYEKLLADAVRKANEIAVEPPLLYSDERAQASHALAQLSDPLLEDWMAKNGLEVQVVNDRFGYRIDVGRKR